MRVTLDHHEEIAPGILTFYFKPQEKPHYTAGQFIEFNFKHDNPDERGTKRWFTLSSAPEEKLLTITTRFAGKNSSSFKRALVQLQPGTPLTFSPPEGDFTLPSDSTTDIFFVAGGIGITPLHSMVSHLLQTGDKYNVHLLYGVNTSKDAVFLDTFEDYGADVRVIVSKPPKDWQGESGQIDADKIIQAVGDRKNYMIYLSGPEPMVETFDKDLKAKGISNKRIKTDFFPGYNHI